MLCVLRPKSTMLAASLVALIGLGSAVAPTALADEMRPGHVEGEGTRFEVTDSEYLNVTVESTEVIELWLDSFPQVVSLEIEPAGSAPTATITVSGLPPSTTMHKYQDGFEDHVVFTTDEAGGYTFEQDLSIGHHVMIKPTESTYFISDDATGGDCTAIGTWDWSSKTCTLTTDVNETIQVNNVGITLDGAGHTLSVPVTSGPYGVYKYGGTMTCKNLNIVNTAYGIFTERAIVSILDNTITGGGTPIRVRGHSSTVRGNVLANSDGRLGWGIMLVRTGGATIQDNHISGQRFGIYTSRSSNNTIIGNTFTDNGVGYANGYNASGNVIYHNNFIGNDAQAPGAAPDITYSTELLEGNFWSDYTGLDDGSGTDKHAIAGDGIGDTSLPWHGDLYPLMGPRHSATLVADHRFWGDLKSSVAGAPDLVDLGSGDGTFTAEPVDGGPSTGCFNFATATGLSLDVTGFNFLNYGYSVVVLVRFDQLYGWRKILDFNDRNSDNGLYVYYSDLMYWRFGQILGDPTPKFTESDYTQVVYTRDANGTIRVYADGLPDLETADTSDSNHDGFAATNLIFFRDDMVTGDYENSSGAVARIRLYQGVLDADEVAALDRASIAPDTDGDGLPDFIDNCPAVANAGQENSDDDGAGNACDNCPFDPNNDADGDGVCGDVDNCPGVANGDQANFDGDSLGDACDNCPVDPNNDADGDGVCGDVDNCPGVANGSQANSDGDSLGDACDNCPLDPNNDADGDGVCGDVDNCPLTPNAAQVDTDGDLAGDLCDVCPADPLDACNQQGSTAEEIPADEGGTVETPDGGLTIDIDPGDLSGDETISVTETIPQDPEVDLTVGPNPGLGQAVAVYDLEPDGLVFDSPVTLTVVADVTGLNQNQRNRLKIYIFSDTDDDGVADAFVEVSGTGCSILDGPPDIVTCIAEVSHFSTYALLAPLDTDDDGVPDLFAPDSDNCPVVPNPGQEDCDTDGEGDFCDPQGPAIEIHAAKHTVGSGSHPGSTKDPLVDIEVCAYDKSVGSCAHNYGVSWQHYADIVLGDDDTSAPCAPVNCATTDANGVAVINLPPGDYIVITHFDSDGGGGPDQFLGVSASNLICGELMNKHLQLLQDANGNKKPGKTTRLTGSELLIIEPEYILWDDTEQLYPFVFETVGDWAVTTSVTPPEGFVADYGQLSADVYNTIEAVQFIITEVGSDLVPTETTFEVTHNGQSHIVHGHVGIMLTPAYAESRGFNVAVLRAQGLIKEHPGNQGQGQGNPSGP